MPFRIIQSNDKVAEVQVICDCCGKLIQTRLVPKKDTDPHKTITVTCFQCKQAKSAKKQP